MNLISLVYSCNACSSWVLRERRESLAYEAAIYYSVEQTDRAIQVHWS
jgi:hypothetical protein